MLRLRSECPPPIFDSVPSNGRKAEDQKAYELQNDPMTQLCRDDIGRMGHAHHSQKTCDQSGASFEKEKESLVPRLSWKGRRGQHDSRGGGKNSTHFLFKNCLSKVANSADFEEQEGVENEGRGCRGMEERAAERETGGDREAQI